MSRIGIVFVTAVLASSASSATWAQHTGSRPAEHRGSEQPRGVVTGGSAQSGIALRSDAAKVDGSVSAVSGGVSVNARDNLRGNTPPHNVKMVFSLNTGNYLSDVQVKVTDRSGKVLIDDLSNGPWLYAQLPAGSYKAAATYNGKTVTQSFSVGRSGVRTAHFRWPASVEHEAVGAAGAQAGGQILGTGPQEIR